MDVAEVVVQMMRQSKMRLVASSNLSVYFTRVSHVIAFYEWTSRVQPSSRAEIALKAGSGHILYIEIF